MILKIESPDGGYAYYETAKVTFIDTRSKYAHDFFFDENHQFGRCGREGEEDLTPDATRVQRFALVYAKDGSYRKIAFDGLAYLMENGKTVETVPASIAYASGKEDAA